MCLWSGYQLHHNTAKHGCSGVVKESIGEWNETLLSSAMEFASDGHTPVRRRHGEHHLPECIRPRHIGPNSGFMVWEGGISYISRSDLVFLQGKVNSVRYIAQVVNPMLLPFLRQEDDVLFSRTTHVHIRLLKSNVFFAVYCPSQQDPHISLQLNMYGT